METSKTQKLADQVFTFMARAVFKPSLTMPIAHFFSLNLRGVFEPQRCVKILANLWSYTFLFGLIKSGEMIFPLVWEVIEALEMYCIPVTSLTSDGAKPNLRFYRMCQKSRRVVPYKTSNPFREDETLYFFCDVPHLLKTSRNCFRNSYSHSKTRTMQVHTCIPILYMQKL